MAVEYKKKKKSLSAKSLNAMRGKREREIYLFYITRENERNGCKNLNLEMGIEQF